MKESWICRDYKRGDEHQILSLFAEVFQREMSLAFWKWRFIENPFGKGIIKVLFDDDKLIGHYAIIPMSIQVQGELIEAAFSMTTMIHPAYQGQGIFTHLGTRAYEDAVRQGIKFVYGFPNKRAYHPFTKGLNWECCKIATLERTSRVQGIEELTGNFQEIKTFDSNANLLWEKVKQDFPIIVPRTQQFLNWRFSQAMKAPGTTNDTDRTRVILTAKSELLGYIVLKVYTKGNTLKGHIVDLLAIRNREIICKLLNYSYSYFALMGVDNLSCWELNSPFYNHILQEEGFVRKESEVYFGVKILSKNDSLARSIKQFSDWFITMADSDIF